MSYRIGIDIESISDVQAAAEKHKQFLDKVLTKSEQKQLAGRKGNGYYAYLAGRFSSKEAYAKATGFGIGSKVNFTDIEILDDENGAPRLSVSGRSLFLNAKSYQISISHKIKLDLVATEVLIEVEDGNSDS
ncbi:holo-ACP synthase [Oenococcus oeni]|uniref:Holo-[acyl-carrier-protein] synthase n=6 Tax=Oenococcus oeni TaxID=1247 RepID=ACPS_OENOB|nr:holo-ACP synthase [Oenococcus oeni]Q04DI0.1 RecName: Full=Holo-[acyl-carrier-protein] synthase; Short=Holo-ACP synthase; AltName: Full=4'-phosphopantetheinyl transferase AcpS [Oenococcus oeni PSU-1]KGO17157.1 ACP synthase [Oenococcus oeni X2L]ABJ57492.1 Phosphopantetheinyl transferase (holo-ACP synthase) [Oenococcus oeni PSU-1]AWW98987.1 holo-ACP synthase [Oenococcus oeni]EFD87846.1 hypothetical protein AWRIB429_1672 [Oenococcus oeni AWRIB429]EJN92461.1 phosphopantetheinyl transferase (hol